MVMQIKLSSIDDHFHKEKSLWRFYIPVMYVPITIQFRSDPQKSKHSPNQLYKESIKDALSGLSQFLATGSLFKMINNAFYFTLNALFVLKVFEFLSWLFSHVEKRLDWKDEVNFKIDDVTTWLTNNCNPHIARSKGNQAMKFGQLMEYNTRNNFLEKSYTKQSGQKFEYLVNEKSF